MTIESTRAAIQGAQAQMDALLKARKDAVDALDEIALTLDDLDFPDTPLGRSLITATVSAYGRAYNYIDKEGDGEPFEFSRAKEHVDGLCELLKTLAREASREAKPVPA